MFVAYVNLDTSWRKSHLLNIYDGDVSQYPLRLEVTYDICEVESVREDVWLGGVPARSFFRSDGKRSIIGTACTRTVIPASHLRET